MKKQYENKLNMYVAVYTLLTEHAETINAHPSIVAAHTALGELLERIYSTSRERREVVAGRTSTKADTRQQLTYELLRIAGPLYTWARRNGSHDVLERVDLNETKIKALRDTLVIDRAREILANARAHAGDIEPLGVTADMIDSLEQHLAAYDRALGERETGAARRVGATRTLNTLFSDADKLLRDELDRLMHLVRFTHRELYNQYTAARVVRHLGIRRRRNGEVPEQVASSGSGGITNGEPPGSTAPA